MKTSNRSGLVAAVRQLLATCALLAGGACWAALGSDLSSVMSDQQAFGATSAATPIPGATLYTQSLGNGVTVRQYVDAAGFVFAVGWDGPVMPNFQRLLATHFVIYQDAVRQQRRGVSLQGADLVIESGGMMRSFAGRAYLPPKVPAALDASGIH